MSRVLLFLLCLSGLHACGARAQTAAAFRDSAIRINAEINVLRDSLFERDSTVAEVARQGRVSISASPRERAAASKAFADFLAERIRWFGAAVPSPDGFRIVVHSIQAASIFGRFGNQGREGRVVLAGLPDTGRTSRVERGAAPKELGTALLLAYTEIMFRGLGAGMRQWLVDAPPLQMEEHERRYLAMYSALTSTGKAGRGCLTGRIDYCSFALGLRPAPSADLTDAYPQVARFDFFMSVLGSGGPEAWARLQAEQSGRAEAALAAAGRAPVDSLVSAWRSSLVGLRPATSPLAPREGLLMAGWTAGLLLGTLVVSRWR